MRYKTPRSNLRLGVLPQMVKCYDPRSREISQPRGFRGSDGFAEDLGGGDLGGFSNGNQAVNKS